MFRLSLDASGPLRAVKELKHKITDLSTMGALLKLVSNGIWVRNIAERFAQSAARTSYREELPFTMSWLSPEFVKDLSGSLNAAWANKTEEERRGAYTRMGLTDDIINAIKASDAFKTNMAGSTVIMVGIGDIEKLNNISALNGTEWYLWQLLEYGTGLYGNAHQVILRMGKQIFYDRDKSGEGVLVTTITASAGFKGRHAFMEATGDFHASDKLSADFIIDYMRYWVNNFSHKKIKK